MGARSAIRFVSSDSGEPARALERAEIVISSDGLGWSGVRVEAGRNPPWHVRDVCVPEHFVGLNTDTAALRFDAVVEGTKQTVTLAPGQMWFCPAGVSFSHDVPVCAGFTLVTIDPLKVRRALGDEDPLELRKAYEVERPQLGYLVRAFAAEAEQRNPGGALFVDALATALAAQIVDAFGVRQAVTERRGLSAVALRRVFEFVDENLGEGLTVEAMARVAQLSPAHFARAFKEATGTSPHKFVMARRLEEARKALELRNADVLNVALRFGFADQAHLTRLFKSAFGVTPGLFARRHSRR